MHDLQPLPVTQAVRIALRDSPSALSDLLFLEGWQMHRTANLGAALRAGQIRRANPELAAAIERELEAASSDAAAKRHLCTVAAKQHLFT
jgi:hypothetical protein